MVDFQSRDTRRGPVADDDDDAVDGEDAALEAAKAPEEPDTEQVAASGTESEPAASVLALAR